MTQAQQSQHAEVQMTLLRAIPCMAMHQTALPFVQRALVPFSQPGALVGPHHILLPSLSFLTQSLALPHLATFALVLHALGLMFLLWYMLCWSKCNGK